MPGAVPWSHGEGVREEAEDVGELTLSIGRWLKGRHLLFDERSQACDENGLLRFARIGRLIHVFEEGPERDLFLFRVIGISG